MPGVTTLSKTQIGVEASAGGATDIATTIWRGRGKLKDTREIRTPAEDVGKIGGTTRSYVPKTEGALELTGEATFEQLGYVLNAGIFAATPTTDTGSGYIRTWGVQYNSTDPLSSSDLGTLVVESGDNQQAEVARFGFVGDYTLSGDQGEAVQLAANGMTRAPAPGSFTAVGDTDLENAAEIILTSKGALSIDAATDTPGTTPKTLTLLSFSFKHTTGWVPLPARDARLDYSDIKHIGDELLLDVTFEHNSIAVAEKAAFRAETERAIQLKFVGSALGSAGAYTYKTLIINLWGKWIDFGAAGLEDQDGDNIYRGTFRVAYSAAAANKAQIILVTDQATLP